MKPNTSEGFARILMIYLQLGCVSFGGPAAHLGYFREAFVVRRKWLTEEDYAELIALCQSVPGPSSSQLGFAIGWLRGGLLGGLAAWLGFTLPSALIMIGVAYGLLSLGGATQDSVDGLLAATVAIVVSAVLGMAKKMCPDLPRLILAICCAALAVLVPGNLVQLLVVLVGAAFGMLFYKSQKDVEPVPAEDKEWVTGGLPTKSLVFVFFALLVVAVFWPASWSGAIYAKHYEAGALVFGGGHVVLPLLVDSVVATGLMAERDILAGYSAAQAMPGPLFTLSAFNGTVGSGNILGGLLALGAIFLPGMILVAALLSSWGHFRKNLLAKAAMVGVNAGVVGLLLAALIDPVWPKGITSWTHFALAAAAFVALERLKMPAWSVVLVCGGLGLVV